MHQNNMHIPGLAELQHATGIIYLELCKACDTVPHNIPVSKTDTHRFNRWTTQWIRNCLNVHTQRDAVNGSMSRQRPVTTGIPQGSILPVLFNIFFMFEMNTGTEGILSKFPGHTKLCGEAGTLEGRDAIQRDLNRLER